MRNNVLNCRLSTLFEPPTVFAHKTGTLQGVARDVGILTGPGFSATLANIATVAVATGTAGRWQPGRGAGAF